MSEKKWTVIPNKILSHLEFSDCDDTIDGICHSTGSLQECIDLCKNDKTGTCKTGYFIKMNNRQNICAPLREYETNQSSPYYRLRDKSYYPVLKDSQTFVFSNHDYPPRLPNALFFLDHFLIQNKNTGSYIGINQTTSSLEFTTTSPAHFRFLQKDIQQSDVENYVYIRNGSDIVINVPKTSFVFNKNVSSVTSSENINLKMGLSFSNTDENTFQIFCLENNKNDILNYDNQFYFMSNEELVVFDSENNVLKTINSTLENALKNNENILFKLIPKIEVYYCDDNKTCNSVSLENTKTSGNLAYYKGKEVYRSSSCWNLCDKKKGYSDVWIYVVLLITCSLVLVVFKKF